MTASDKKQLRELINIKVSNNEIKKPGNVRLEIRSTKLADGRRLYYGVWRERNKGRKFVSYVSFYNLPKQNLKNYIQNSKRIDV